MYISPKRYNILFKAIAAALACLFLVNDMGFGLSVVSEQSEIATLAPPSATKPPCEIKYDKKTDRYHVVKSGDKETVRSYEAGVAVPNNQAFRDRWALAVDNKEIVKLLNEFLFSRKKEIKNKSLYVLIHLYNSNERSFLETWQSMKLNPDTKAIIKQAEDSGVLDRVQNNVLRKITQLKESMQEKMKTSQSEIQIWSYEAGRNAAQGKVRTLMILTAPLFKGAGSAVVLQEILKEHNNRGNDSYVSVADYGETQAQDLGLIKGRNLDTIVFKNPEEYQESNVDISFPIPTYSKGMPFPHTRFKDLDDIQLIEFLEVYSDHLKKIIGDFKPDVIHTNHLFLLNPLVKVIAPWIPVVCTTHGSEEKMMMEDNHLAPLVVPGAQVAEKIFSISPAVTAEAQTIYGIDNNRIILAKNGYDNSVFFPKNISRKDLLEKYGIKDNFARVVLYVGKYADWKGIDYLVESAAKYSKDEKMGSVLTLIVGNGPESLKNKYQNKINELGLGNKVKLIGKVPHEEIANFMNIADVFVLPSLSEPFGLSLLEALGCGCRVVSTDQGGPPSFVPQKLREEGLAVLVESLHMTEKHTIQVEDVPSFIDRLSAAIMGTLQNETSFGDREKISTAVRHMSWSGVYETIHAAYQEVIAERLKSFSQAESAAIAFFDNINTLVSNVEFHPSALCNLRCKGCTYYSQHGKGMFPFWHLDKIAVLHPDEIIIAGGGEPVLYNDNGMTFNELILKLKELLPNTKIRLVTNGTFIPKGDWQNKISSLKVSMYGFNRQQYIDYAGKDVFEKVWCNIFDNYLLGPIPHITISPLVQKKDYQYVPDFVEMAWNQWQRYRKQGLIPPGKKLEIALTPFADDTSMSNPYAPSNPDDFTQEYWKKSWDIKEKSDTPFGKFLLQQSKKSAAERAKNDFILPEEIFVKTLPVRVVEGATKCVHPAGYVLVNPEEKVYPCFLMAVRKEAALGNITMSPENLLTQRKQIMGNPPKVCAEGCRVPLTRCGEIVLDMIRKRSQAKSAIERISTLLAKMPEELFAGIVSAIDMLHAMLDDVDRPDVRRTGDGKWAFVFSEDITFNHGLGYALPAIAEKGARVAVVVSRDEAKAKQERVLVDGLNAKLKELGVSPDKYIRCIDRLETATSDLGVVHCYYFRMNDDKDNFTKMEGVTPINVAAEAVRLILEAIGRVCHMPVEKEATLEELRKEFVDIAA